MPILYEMQGTSYLIVIIPSWTTIFFSLIFDEKKKYKQISQFHPLRRYDVILFFLFIYIHLFLKKFAQFIFLACDKRFNGTLNAKY